MGTTVSEPPHRSLLHLRIVLLPSRAEPSAHQERPGDLLHLNLPIQNAPALFALADPDLPAGRALSGKRGQLNRAAAGIGVGDFLRDRLKVAELAGGTRGRAEDYSVEVEVPLGGRQVDFAESVDSPRQELQEGLVQLEIDLQLENPVEDLQSFQPKEREHLHELQEGEEFEAASETLLVSISLEAPELNPSLAEERMIGMQGPNSRLKLASFAKDSQGTPSK